MVHGQSGKRSDDGHATASLPVPPGWIEEPDPGSRCPTCLPMAAGPRGSQHTDMDGGPRPPPLLASGFRPHTEGGPALDSCRPISSDRACRARSEGRRVAARPAPDGQGQADRPAQRVRPRRPVVARPDGPHDVAAAGEAHALLARPLRHARSGHAAHAAPEPDAAPVRHGLLPAPAAAGHARPGDAALPLARRLPQGLAERELRPRAHGALHPRGRLRRARRPRGRPRADRLARLAPRRRR